MHLQDNNNEKKRKRKKRIDCFVRDRFHNHLNNKIFISLFQGVQSQDRHLFLFNDLLLIAKPRSGGNFKLKEKVRISEIWLTKCCLDDVSELHRSEDTSFVIGWPTTNLVVTFRYLLSFIFIIIFFFFRSYFFIFSLLNVDP